MKIILLSFLFFSIYLQACGGVLIEMCHGLWLDFAELKDIAKSTAGKDFVERVKNWAEFKFDRVLPTLTVVNAGIVDESGNKSLGIWKISESEYFYTANLTKTTFYAVTHIGEITTSQHLAEEAGNNYLGQQSAFKEPLWQNGLDWMNLSDSPQEVIGKISTSIQPFLAEALKTQLNVQADQMQEITLLGVWRCDSFREGELGHQMVAILKYDAYYSFATMVHYVNNQAIVPMSIGKFQPNSFKCELALYKRLKSAVTAFQKLV